MPTAEGLPVGLAVRLDALADRRGLGADDLDELRDHLEAEYADLRALGLTPDEAALVAEHRLGRDADLDEEYLAVHPERAWRRIDEGGARPRWHLPLALCLGLVAGVLVRLALEWEGKEHLPLLLRAIPLIPIGLLGLYFAATAKGRDRVGLGLLVGGIGAGLLVALFYPGDPYGQTLPLTAMHLPVLLLVLLGLARLGKRWRGLEAWMDWVRFLGEAAVYYVLTALGGGVVIALLVAIFSAVGITEAGPLGTALSWIVPICAVGALFVCAWLVEFKKSAMENVAPVLTSIFTPVLALALLSFLVVVAVSGTPVEVDRFVLIAFDALLVVVEAIVLFTVSARPVESGPRVLDWMQLALIGAGILVDLLEAWALSGRLVEYGASPNKLAALVLNLILLALLVGAALAYIRILRGRPALGLVKQQALALPVLGAWAGVVAFAFPPLFSFA